jgi:hypothetical protein
MTSKSLRYDFEITSGSPICGGGIPTINVRMQMVCTYIGTLLNTQLALCGALSVTGRQLVAVAGRLVVEVG